MTNSWADALVTAGITGDALLYQQYALGEPGLAGSLAVSGTDQIMIQQAAGMIAEQLDDTTPTRWRGLQ